MSRIGWEVYMIMTRTKQLYTGITNNLERRFTAHSRGKGARFFSFSEPESIVYREIRSDRSSASKRESEIKKMNRADKLALIASFTPLEVLRVDLQNKAEGQNPKKKRPKKALPLK